MTLTPDRAKRIEERSLKRALWVGTAVLVLLGLAWAESIEEVFAYLLVIGAALLPTFIWLQQGRFGVPVLPAIGVLHILYYAIPIVRSREDMAEYAYADILRAAATVSFFLLISTLAWFLLVRGVRPPAIARAGLLSDAQMVILIFLGLGVGNLFLLLASAGQLGFVGGLFGVVRSFSLTALLVACFFMGVARGRRILRGRFWLLALAGLGLAIAVSWSSLYLIGGMLYLLATSAGYVSTSGRIPWVVVTGTVVVVSILHAGKEEMRLRYWRSDGGGASASGILRLPGLASEWFVAGIQGLGSTKYNRSALDRASLLQILMKVQYMTPAFIDYARGETYALLPGMLVPRFLSPNKTKSKASMDLLNVRYGIQTVEATESTSVGWGLIAEGYANFGLLGVGCVGLLLGIVSGYLTRWSARGSTVSIPTLVAVASMILLINLEQDLAAITLSFLQSLVAVFAFAAVLRLFPKPKTPNLGAFAPVGPAASRAFPSPGASRAGPD